PMDADADFVAFVQSIDLNNPANLQITDMVIRWHLEVNKNTEKFSANRMKLMKTMVDNQEVINELSNKIMQIELTVGSKDLAATFEQYKQTSTDTEAIEKFSITYNQLVKLAKGAPASDFEMKDVKGNTVRFLEVVGKGKVVYIDFWASWCGPCKQEIPYVEKLVEKYKGNPNIEFISISLDHKLDNWHAQLDHDKPTWRQFIIPDNFNSTFAKEYNIQAIPRFMVFDKKGRIIDIGALRPSDPNIDAFLEACMK
ncbi:MAG: TlpA family protein disulfide reductase, partial [Prevotellaceae bacterium]|nr:TlpA family protein disulfide reductase [Prevotellaceae bacterium]